MPKGLRTAIYPGSFDPITWGHVDIIARASKLFDKVIVAIARNPLKEPTFPLAERIPMIEAAIRQLRLTKVVTVGHFDGLLVAYARRRGACAVVRGLRAVSDFEYEFQMALMNRHQAKNIETVFLMPDERYVYLSSNLVKEIARLGGDVDAFVPHPVKEKLRLRLRRPRVNG